MTSEPDSPATVTGAQPRRAVAGRPRGRRVAALLGAAAPLAAVAALAAAPLAAAVPVAAPPSTLHAATLLSGGGYKAAVQFGALNVKWPDDGGD